MSMASFLAVHRHSVATLVFLALFNTFTYAQTTISSADDLKDFVESVNDGNNYDGETILLASDIDLEEEDWIPIGDDENPFAGTFDGQGYTISGLQVSGVQYSGLFGYVYGGQIKNLKVIAAEVKTISTSSSNAGYAGILVGYASNATIENGYVSGKMTSGSGSYNRAGGLAGTIANTTVKNSYSKASVLENSSYGYTGGLVGEATGSSFIENSFSSGNVTGYNNVGGLVGQISSGILTIENSYASGTVYSGGYAYVGGLIGYPQNSGPNVINNSYASGKVSGGFYSGGILGTGSNTGNTIDNVYFNLDGNSNGVGNGTATGFTGLSSTELRKSENLEGFDFSNIWGIYADINKGYPHLLAFADEYEYDPDPATIITEIANEADLIKFANDVNGGKDFAGETILLTANIELTEDWTPIGKDQNLPFAGNFNGQGHTISGLSVSDAQYAGLFGFVENGQVKNLSIIASEVKTRTSTGSTGNNRNSAGILAGRYASSMPIENVYASGDVSCAGTSNTAYCAAGGLVGSITTASSIKNSYASVNISTSGSYPNNAGGFVGMVNAVLSISNSYVKGNVSCEGAASGNNVCAAGGFAGVANANLAIENGYASVEVSSSTSSRLGGILGNNASATVTGTSVYFNADEIDKGVGNGNATGFEGLSSDELKAQASFVGWNFRSIWGIDEGNDYPYLLAFDPDYIPQMPIEIASAEDLIELAIWVNQEGYSYAGITVKLMADIVLTEGWTPIGISKDLAFKGIFDGQGYTISGLSVKDEFDAVGLFGYVGDGAQIKNLGIVDADIEVNSENSFAGVGIFAGNSDGDVIISNSYASGSILINEANMPYVGGLVGNAEGSLTIENSYAIVNFDDTEWGTMAIGGLIGSTQTGSGPHKIENSYAIASLVDDDYGYYFGGIIGYNMSSSTTVESVYYNEGEDPSNGLSITGVITALSNSELKNKSFFAGLDFENVWGISSKANNGSPYLQVFIKEYYTVAFNSDGGSSVNLQKVNTYDDFLATEPANPTKTGYAFAGWFNGDVEFDFATTITADLTLTAKWTINTYTVAFNSDGGTEVSSQEVDYNSLATEPTAPTKEGYIFAGWFNGNAEFDFATAITADLELTAKWEEDTTPIIASQSLNMGSVIVVKNGLDLHVKNTASLKVYDLNGQLAKSLNYSSGTYFVSLADLSKGAYIVRATFGSETKTIRVSIK